MFHPPFWFRNPHLQTTWGRVVRPRRAVATRREVLPAPDGDELILDHLDAPDPKRHYVLLHGLEGSSNSVYIQGLLRAIAATGASATALNFRSCARDPGDLSRMIPNRRPRFYHSGETTDFDFVVRTLASRLSIPIVAAGASLGGNVLLKWLGENPGQTIVAAAAAISVPFDLAEGGKYLERGFGPFYVQEFLRTLRPKTISIVERFPETRPLVPLKEALASRTFFEFDETVTAPLHAFRGANDYYERSSSIRFLHRIDTPALCLSAEDDPFVPPEVFRRVRGEASKAIDFRLSPFGGHTGFMSGLASRGPSWAEQTAVEWLAARC